MKDRPLPILLGEGAALLVLLIVLGTIGISIGSAVNDGLKLTFAEKPVDSTPSWSPDGSLIAFVRTTGGKAAIYVMDADGAEQVRLAPAAGKTALDWLSTRRITFLRDGRVFATAVDGGTAGPLPRMPVSRLSHPAARALSPDRRRLAFARDGHIWVGDRKGRNAVQLTGT